MDALHKIKFWVLRNFQQSDNCDVRRNGQCGDIQAFKRIKENCQDISADAKEINEKRYAEEREREIADAKAVLDYLQDVPGAKKAEVNERTANAIIFSDINKADNHGNKGNPVHHKG